MKTFRLLQGLGLSTNYTKVPTIGCNNNEKEKIAMEKISNPLKALLKSIARACS